MATMGVGRIPGRKRPALWIEDGNEIRVLAFFSSGAAMREFLQWQPMGTPPGESYVISEQPVMGPLTRTEHARRARELHNGS